MRNQQIVYHLPICITLELYLIDRSGRSYLSEFKIRSIGTNESKTLPAQKLNFYEQEQATGVQTNSLF